MRETSETKPLSPFDIYYHDLQCSPDITSFNGKHLAVSKLAKLLESRCCQLKLAILKTMYIYIYANFCGSGP